MKATAAGVLSCILSTRKTGQVKDILKQAWEFFEILSKDPNKEEHAGVHLAHHVGSQPIVYPVKMKAQPQVKLDVGLEKLVKITVDLLCQEGIKFFVCCFDLATCFTFTNTVVKMSTKQCGSITLYHSPCHRTMVFQHQRVTDSLLVVLLSNIHYDFW